MKYNIVNFLLVLIIFNVNLYSLEVKEISKENISSLPKKELLALKNDLKFNPLNDLNNPHIEWYKFIVPEYITENCYYFSEIKQIFEVYDSNFNKIYQFGDISNPSYLGNPFHIICSDSKIFYFRIFSYDKNRIGIIGKILSGKKEEFYQYLIKKELLDVLLGLIYILASCFGFLLYIFNNKYKLFLHFSLFILFLGIASLTTNNIKYIYYDKAIVWAWINVIALFLTTTYSIIFVINFVVNKFKKIMFYIFIIQFIIGIIYLILAIQNFFLLYRLLILSAYFAIINSFLVFLYIFYNILHKDKEAIYFFIGIIILCSGAILDSIVVLKLLEYNSLYFNISMFLFLMILVAILLREQKSNLKKLEIIEVEFQLAYNVHKKLLPKIIPNLKNTIIQYYYSPSSYLGGDLISFIEMNDYQLGVFIGDISGHGISAALYSSKIYHFIKELKNYYYQPKDFLSELNRYIYDFSNSDFVTGVYLIIDLEKKEFRYSSAGHTDILYFFDKKLLLLGQTGPALGIKNYANYQEYVYPIKENSMLILYTDGYIEIFKNKVMLSMFGFIQRILDLNPFEKVHNQKNFFNVLNFYLKNRYHYEFTDDQAGILVYFNNI
jgi:hypothetical protein